MAVGVGAVSAPSSSPMITDAIAFEDSDQSIYSGSTHTMVEVRLDTRINESSIGTSEIGVTTTTGQFMPATAIYGGDEENDSQFFLDIGPQLDHGEIQFVNITPGSSFDLFSGSTISGTTIQNASVTPTTTTMTEGSGYPDRTVYYGETIAFLGDDAGESILLRGATGEPFEFDGQVTDDGQVYTINTSTLQQQIPYAVAFDDSATPDTGLTIGVDDDSDGEVDEDRLLRMREFTLDLSIDENLTIDDSDITNLETLTGRVTANVGNTDILVLVRGPGEDDLDQQIITLGGDGTATFEFENRSIDEADDHITVIAQHQPTGVSAIRDVKVGKIDFDAEFDETTFSDERGDIVNITVNLSPSPEDKEDTDYATVRVGGADIGYSANLTLHDRNDDEEVTLQWNTYAADGPGGQDEFSVAPNDPDEQPDSVTVLDISSRVSGGPDDILDAGGYELEVVGRANTSTEPAQDVSMVGLHPRNLSTISVMTAPKGYSSLNSLSGIHTGLRSGDITLTSAVAIGDYLILSIEGTGLEGAIESQSGSNSTAKFTNFTDAEASLVLNQTNPEPNTDVKLIDHSDYSNVSLLANPGNDTYYLVVDTENGQVREDVNGNQTVDATDDIAEFADGDRYVATFSIESPKGGLTNSNESVRTGWQMVDPSASVETERVGGDEIVVVSELEQSITGATNVAPGTPITIRVQAPSLLLNKRVLVSGNRTWSAAFDFGDLTTGSNFTIEVIQDGEALLDEPVNGRVQYGSDAETTTTSINTTRTATTSVRTETQTSTKSTTTASATTTSQTPTTTTSTSKPHPTTTSTTTPGFGISLAVIGLVFGALLTRRQYL